MENKEGATLCEDSISVDAALTEDFQSFWHGSLNIELTNDTPETLSDPKVYMSSGQIQNPPPPNIHANQKATFSFRKDDLLLKAVYGVTTYDVCKGEGGETAVCRLAIMFSVPYDRVTYKNVLGIGIFAPATTCDNSLLNLMYRGHEPYFKSQVATGSELSHSGKGYVIQATMSQTADAIMKVDLQKGKP